MVAGAWVGFDQAAPLGKGETGARAAAPSGWGSCRRCSTADPFRISRCPTAWCSPRSTRKPDCCPIPESKKTLFECFKAGTVPTEHTKRPGEITDAEDFYKAVM